MKIIKPTFSTRSTVVNTILRCLPPAQYFRVSVFLSPIYSVSGFDFIIPSPGSFCYRSLSLFTSLRTSRTVPPLNTASDVSDVSMDTDNSKFRFSQKAAAVDEIHAGHLLHLTPPYEDTSYPAFN